MKPKDQGQFAKQKQLARISNAIAGTGTRGIEPPKIKPAGSPRAGAEFPETQPMGAPNNNVQSAQFSYTVDRAFRPHLSPTSLANSSAHVPERALFRAYAQPHTFPSPAFSSQLPSLVSSKLNKTNLIRLARHKTPDERERQASLQSVCDVVCGVPGSPAVPNLGGCGLLGIDTVRLFFYVSNGVVSHNHCLKLVRKRKKKRTHVLWTDDAQQRVEGVEAFWHDAETDINVLIQPFAEFSGIKSIGCFVTFSVASIRGTGNNYEPASHQETRAIFAFVADQLASIGINVDLSQAYVSRLDLFKNLEMNRSCQVYWPVLDHLRPTSMENHRYPTGRTQRNNQHELAGYDKRVERVVRGWNVDALPKFVLRLEYRLSKAAKAQSILGFKTVGELLNNLEHLSEVYNSVLLQYWFKQSPQQLKAQFQKPSSGDLQPCSPGSVTARSPRKRSSCKKNISPKDVCPIGQKISVVVRYLEKHLLHPLPRQLTKKGLQRILGQEGVEGYRKVLQGVTQLSHQYVSHAVTEMKAALMQKAADLQPDFIDLYEELYSKALGSSKALDGAGDVSKIENKNVFVPAASVSDHRLVTPMRDVFALSALCCSEVAVSTLCEGGIRSRFVPFHAFWHPP